MWTNEENHVFKNAVVAFTAFSCNRFENIAARIEKSVADVKKYYEKLVDDLLRGTTWNIEEHEWFLIGLKRFDGDLKETAVLIHSKNNLEVRMYAENYFLWPNFEINRSNFAHMATMDINEISSADERETSVPVQMMLQSWSQSQFQPQPQPQPQPQSQSQFQPQPQSQPQPQLQSQPQTQLQSQLQLQSQPRLQSQPQPQLEEGVSIGLEMYNHKKKSSS